MIAGSPEVEAVIFDTDGVVTNTAVVHFAAWKHVFDEFLSHRAGTGPFLPFTGGDYRRFVDGAPRYDGVARFLASREIALPRGAPSDAPGDTTVCALGNRKNAFFLEVLRTDGVEAFASTIRLIHDLHAAGIRTAVISASENCGEMLAAADVDDLFEVRVDGLDAHRLGLPGKPDPAIFLEAARRLGVDPRRAAIVEDAIVGAEAGRAGGFGLVIAIDRTGHPDDLARFADIVVSDPACLVVDDSGIHALDLPSRPLRSLPSALNHPAMPERLAGRRPAIFLDYDGTLSPIAPRPELARLDPAIRDVLSRLAHRYTVGIISGRDLADVQGMVAAEGLWFAGSHGLDIVSPTGVRRDVDGSDEILPLLDRAETLLADRIAQVPEAWIERKRFAIAVHFRQTPEEHTPELEAIVTQVATEAPGLRMTGGKKIFELRPDLDWDKGVALRWVMETTGLGDDVVPIYIGDDETDEDAFAAIRDDGIAVVVGDDDHRETSAHFRLANTEEVRLFLCQLNDMDEEAT